MTVSDILKRENNNLDLVRIILATMVIWSHSFALNFGNGSGEPLLNFIKNTSAGGLGVDVFFFVSGLLVTNSLIKKKSISKLILSRVFRLLPALVFLLIITVFIIGPFVTSLSMNEYFSNGQTWKYIIHNLLLSTDYQLPGCFLNNIWPSDINGSLWTLPLEVGCYVLLLGIFLLVRGRKKLANLFLLSIILISILPNSLLLPLFERSYIIGVVPTACFAFGTFFAINQEDIEVDYKMMLGVSLVLLFFWRYINIIHILFPIAVSIFLLLFSKDKRIIKLKPKYDISYGLYIWHFPILQILFMNFGQMNVYLLFFLAFLVSSSISLLSYIFIEKKSIDFGYKLGNIVTNSSFNFERISIYSLILMVIIILAKTH
jgi:peptidoglycan/LPS O-acetylase OafA/YrhL